MKIKAAEKRMLLRWSKAAGVLIEQLGEDFPIEAFEKWVIKNKFLVGDAYILEFLAERKKLSDNIINETYENPENINYKNP